MEAKRLWVAGKQRDEAKHTCERVSRSPAPAPAQCIHTIVPRRLDPSTSNNRTSFPSREHPLAPAELNSRRSPSVCRRPAAQSRPVSFPSLHSLTPSSSGYRQRTCEKGPH